ncbi:MAG: ATP-binding protein [Myxococcota bacterium]
MSGSLAALTLLDASVATLIAVAMAALDRVARQRHTRLWAVGWSFLAVTELLSANTFLGAYVPLPSSLQGLTAAVAILSLVAGTLAVAGKRYSHRWTVVVVLGAFGTVGLDIAGVPRHLASIPAIAALSLAFGWAGVRLWFAPLEGVAHRVAAAVIVAWNVHVATYPVLSEGASLPWGLSLHVLFEISTAAAMLLLHVELDREALARTSAELESLIERSVVGIGRTASDGTFLLANPAFLKIVGDPSVDVLRDRTTLQGLFVDSAVHDELRTELQLHGTSEVETAWVDAGGHHRGVRLHMTQVRDGKGAPTYLEHAVIDVTAQRQLQERLQAAQRLQAVGRLTGGIAHDFNNLLMVIMGNLSEMHEDGPSEATSDALEACQRAASLTSQLLTFARTQEHSDPNTDVILQIEVLRRLLARTLPARTSLVVDYAEASLNAAIPATDLDQIVMNLVLNARDALGPRAGHIWVRAGRVAGGGRPWVQLEVEDDGPGVPDEIRGRMFQPFVTTRGAEGTGLGLAIVVDVVEKAGGTIELVSSSEAGSCLRVRLPCGTAPASVAPGDVTSGTGTVLVVDDDETVRRVTARILQRKGYQVITASGVQDAWAHVSDDIDVVVTDVWMTDGDGVELMRRLAERWPPIACVLISGLPDRVLAEHPTVDARSVLAKPFLPRQLVHAVEAARASAVGQPPEHHSA